MSVVDTIMNMDKSITITRIANYPRKTKRRLKNQEKKMRNRRDTHHMQL